MKMGRKGFAPGHAGSDDGSDGDREGGAEGGRERPDDTKAPGSDPRASDPRAVASAMAAATIARPKGLGKGGAKRGFLDGQMLIAMPSMGDERFARTVIYMCAHSADGAMGIIVNQPAPNISFSDLLVQLEVLPAKDLILLPRQAGGVRVLKGGPVDTQRGFVLHSADFYIENSTLPIDEGICLTATLDILKAIARGDGPKSAVLALGYAGWAPGQLENEIHQNGWLHCAADRELIFGTDAEGKYALAMKKIGVEVGMLSTEAGHA
jgi:putative transcriptional regulator